VSNLNNKNNH